MASSVTRSSYRKSIGVLMVVIAAWAFAHPSRADIYRYFDAEGVVHYTNAPPNGMAWTRVYKTPSAAPSDGSAAAATSAANEVADGECVPAAQLRRFNRHVREASGLYQLPEPYIWAILSEVSNYNPKFVSAEGHMGLMGLMPPLAAEMGVVDAFDPRQAVLGGARLARVFANRFKGDLILSTAAYQAGETAVSTYGGVPPNPETRRFVRSVLHRYYVYRACLWTGIARSQVSVRRELDSTALFTRISNSVLLVITESGTQGSAVVVTPNALITNAHVVRGEKRVLVIRGDQVIPASIAQLDVDRDLAVLSVASRVRLQPVAGLRSYADVQIGERVFALGYPTVSATFTDGMVSGKRMLPMNNDSPERMRLIQTNAAISHGSSGGGLFDQAGNLLGVTTFWFKDTQNMNCAIATDEFVVAPLAQQSTPGHRNQKAGSAAR